MNATFANGEYALYKNKNPTDGMVEVVSVVVVRCSYFSPATESEPEFSVYSVRLDGDIVPAVPVYELHAGLIHGVDLKLLVKHTPSEHYELNAGLWALKVKALETAAAAADAANAHKWALERVKKYGMIVPGRRIAWQWDPTKELSGIVTKINLLSGYALVEGDFEVSLRDITHLYP
jgi:hypothetical protein